MNSFPASIGVQRPGLSPVRRASRFSTRTISRDGRIVPWLAAEGPLAYTPEAPPPKDYFFQYGWVLPGILRLDLLRLRHCYFGSWSRQEADEAFAFWNDARAGSTAQIFLKEGSLSAMGVEAPIAVYRHVGRLQRPLYVLIQHGSYQFLKEEEQPELAKGYVTLYRGIQKARTCRWLRLEPSRLDHAQHRTWSLYLRAQKQSLMDPGRFLSMSWRPAPNVLQRELLKQKERRFLMTRLRRKPLRRELFTGRRPTGHATDLPAVLGESVGDEFR